MSNVTVNVPVTPPYAAFRQCEQCVARCTAEDCVKPRVQTPRSPKCLPCSAPFVCLCMCVSARLMDLLEMASGIYYHV